MSNTADLNDNDGLRAAAAALRSSGWLRFATMVEQHIAEVERLRAGLADIEKIVRDGMAVARAEGVEEGEQRVMAYLRAAVDEERAAVVAWLRYQAEVFVDDERALCRAADDIERGDHRREEDE